MILALTYYACLDLDSNAPMALYYSTTFLSFILSILSISPPIYSLTTDSDLDFTVSNHNRQTPLVSLLLSSPILIPCLEFATDRSIAFASLLVNLLVEWNSDYTAIV